MSCSSGWIGQPRPAFGQVDEGVEEADAVLGGGGEVGPDGGEVVGSGQGAQAARYLLPHLDQQPFLRLPSAVCSSASRAFERDRANTNNDVGARGRVPDATLPGVKAEGKTTDPLGRPGTVISLPVETTIPLGFYTAPKQLGAYRRQWIINHGNGTLLAMRDLVATPPHGSRKLPPGDDGKPRRLTVESQPDRFHKPHEVSEYEAYEVAEWTDAAPN